MMDYMLWVCVVGGESDEERIIYEGNDWDEVCKAIEKHDDEVNTDSDKYFLLNDTQFYSYIDFCDLIEKGARV